MKIVRNNLKRKRTLAVLGVALVVLLLAGGVAAHHFQFWPFLPPSSPDSAATTLEKQNKSDSTNPLTKAKAAATSQNVDTSKTTSEVPVADSSKLTITQLAQQNHMVIYTATVADSSANGTCSAVFTSSIAKPVTSTTTANGNTCGPVSIPDSEFSALGTWTLTLRYYSNNTQVDATKTITIK